MVAICTRFNSLPTEYAIDRPESDITCHFSNSSKKISDHINFNMVIEKNKYIPSYFTELSFDILICYIWMLSSPINFIKILSLNKGTFHCQVYLLKFQAKNECLPSLFYIIYIHKVPCPKRGLIPGQETVAQDVAGQKGGGGVLWDGMGKNEQFQLNM